MSTTEPGPTAPEPSSSGAGPLREGDVIDGFVLEERMHQGGMAVLWRVRRDATAIAQEGDAPPEPMLMMKVPRVRSSDDPTTIVGFEVEQMIMPRLSGPHVPRFVAQGSFERQPYIVMEHVSGPSLRPRLDDAPLPVDEVVEIGAKVAAALHELHRQHVIHLDVKPSNIMFRRHADGSVGEAVLIDFGLSRHDQLPDLLEEEFELPMGTGPYMSPEQVQFVRSDPRSDLFALGVMLYHLLTGERPFGAPTSVRGLRQRLYRDPVPPRSWRAECPPWLQEIILRCLEVKPELRHPSAAQLAFDLLHPEQVPLTARASRQARSGALATARRWFAAMGAEPEGVPDASALSARSPIVLAAVDVLGAEPALLDAVRLTVQRVLLTEPGARLACLTVMKINRLGLDSQADAPGSTRHLDLLVQLKHWARPLVAELGLQSEAANGRLTFHVLEAPDPASAIIDYAHKTQVDHIVMGARSNGGLRRFLGSVSAQVAAQAECTVTVVRVHAPHGA
jgi:nucleotide-binding universal stress UspA family protein